MKGGSASLFAVLAIPLCVLCARVGYCLARLDWVLARGRGFFCQFARGGGSYFVSYRDPNLDKTLAVYRRIPEAVRNLAYTREELDGFIISTVGGMDMPLTPAMASTLDFACVRNHLSEELLQKERDEILDCTLETLRGLAPYMEAVIRTDLYCAFSPALQVEEQADLFDETEAL